MAIIFIYKVQYFPFNAHQTSMNIIICGVRISDFLLCIILSTPRLPQAVLQVVDKIPTISTQLKIIAAVKATRQGGDGMW